VSRFPQRGGGRAAGVVVVEREDHRPDLLAHEQIEVIGRAALAKAPPTARFRSDWAHQAGTQSNPTSSGWQLAHQPSLNIQ
jgi:hypothetical protein